MNDPLETYNVVWDSPSKDVTGTMPLGNGDIGINLWVEPNGDLLMLVGKTDAWDENAINMKLARVRVALLPNPFAAGQPFRQSLNLRTGNITIQVERPNDSISVRVWVDANRPVIRIEADGANAFEVRAHVEMWRTKEYAIKTQTGDLFRNLTGNDPYPTIVSPDMVLPETGDQIIWCHHNKPRENDGYQINMRLQGLGDLLETMRHPLLGRTFGAAMEGEGFSRSELTLVSNGPRRSHRLAIYPLTVHPSHLDDWRKKLAETVATVKSVDVKTARAEHERWWDEFWNRSWIYVTAADPADADEAGQAQDVTRGYILQRFMNACAGRGGKGGTIKYNGSIFTVGTPEDPDFRRWGGPGFWFQNQRLIYWPMLACGDFDLMQTWFGMYRDMLPVQKHRTKTYYGHDGAHFPETIMFWGAEVSGHYGWTPFEQRPAPEAECAYVTYYWQCGIEQTLMMWDYFSHSGDEAFARSTLLPMADAITLFYDLHYSRDAAGKLHFEPAESLETWHWAINPLPEIAGLKYTLAKLLELPTQLTTDIQRQRWNRMLGELPAIPVGEKDGRRVILPAERFDKKKNTENPELYCICPYRLFGVDKPDLQLARDTFAVRLHREHDCWSQDDVQMALLGLTEQAKDYVTKRASHASHSDSRFPAFWNAFHDWIPDMDHGGVLQLALQNMLMQCEGKQITLLPAWPKEWNADFKLHASGKTVVEGKVRTGRAVDLRVTPEQRQGDVVVPGRPLVPSPGTPGEG